MVDRQNETERTLAARLARARGLRLWRIPGQPRCAPAPPRRRAAHAFGRESPLTPERVRAAGGRLWFDCTRARAMLGWPDDATSVVT